MLIAGDANQAVVGMDAKGNSLIVSDQQGTFIARSFSASRRLGPTQVVWPQSMGGTVNYVRLIVSPDGYALMLWQARNGDQYARMRYPSGQLGPLDKLTNLGLPGNYYAVLDAVLSGNGRATLLLLADNNSSGTYLSELYIQRLAADGTLDSPIPVAEDNPSTIVGLVSAQPNLLALDPAGNVVISWLQGPSTGACCNQVMISTLSTGGTLSPATPVTPSDTEVSDGFRVLIARSGMRTFVWQHILDAQNSRLAQEIQYRTMTPAGALGPVRTISPVFVWNPDTNRGVQLGGLFAQPFASNALVVWLTNPAHTSTMSKRIVSQGTAGATQTLVSGTGLPSKRRPIQPQPGDGPLIGDSTRALALWQVAAPSTHPGATYYWGVQGRTISSKGKVGPLTSPFPTGEVNPFADTIIAAAMNDGGRTAVISNTYHGLEITTGG